MLEEGVVILSPSGVETVLELEGVGVDSTTGASEALELSPGVE
jgi:hypothetical protein